MLLSSLIPKALKHNWEGTRKYDTIVCWTNDLLAYCGPCETVDGLAERDLTEWRDKDPNLSPATRYARISMVSVLFDQAILHGWNGKKPPIPYPKVPKVAKWWLNPEIQEKAELWLTQHSDLKNSAQFLAFLQWTVLTGLRVEETLALRAYHFQALSSQTPSLLVPGTKTAGAEATLPLSIQAATLAWRLLSEHGGLKGISPQTALFTMSYRDLLTVWQQVRSALGLTASTATPKAFRRTYARHRAAKGIPLPLLQQLMRHSCVETTMGYLTLTGGAFTDEELRPFL